MSSLLPFLGGLCAVIIVLACGRALLPTRSHLPRSRYEEFSVAFLLGAAVVTLFSTAWLAIGLSFFSLFWVLLADAAWSWRHAHRREDTGYSPLGFSKPMAWALAALALGSVAATLAVPINQFDPLLHFAYKGKILFFEETPFTESLLGLTEKDGFGRFVTHPNYPLGIPILEALAAKLGGGWHDRWVQIPLAFWAACLPGAVAFGLRIASAKAARWGALLAASVPMLYFRDGFASEGLAATTWGTPGIGNSVTLGAGADLPVAAVFAAGMALLFRASCTKNTRTAVCAGLALAGTAMMKNEGLALFGVVCLAVLTSGMLFQKSRKIPVTVLGVGILALAPWLFLRAQLPAIDENYGEQLSIENTLHFLGGGEELVELSPKVIAGQKSKEDLLSELPPRRTIVGNAYFSTFSDISTWGIFWLLGFAALGTLALRRSSWHDIRHRTLALTVLGGLALYVLILLVTPWYLPLLLEKGIPERLLLHLIGPTAMLIAWWIVPTEAPDSE